MYTSQQVQDMLKERQTLSVEIEKMQRQKVELEKCIKSYLIEEHLHEAFTVNWDRVRRMVR